jgi:enoyl-CoA hydratase/carnithine racemase
MVEALDAAYRSWDADPGIHAIVLTGSGGGRALCAGGDVKAAVAAVRSGDPGAAVRFFRSEYRLDYLIATLTTPHIALMDGIVMGGGAGLCVHGRFRVATER